MKRAIKHPLPRIRKLGWLAVGVGGAISLVSFSLAGIGIFSIPSSNLTSSAVGVTLANGSLQATNLLPGSPTNTVSMTLTNTGTGTEAFDLQFTGVSDTLTHFRDLGQLEFLVSTIRGTIIYSLDPASPHSIGISSPLTLTSLEGITIPIANAVTAQQHVSIPIAVELASGEGFGNAWNGKSATINYKIIATPSVSTSPSTTAASPPSTSSSKVVVPTTSAATTSPSELRLVTGPPQAPLDYTWDTEVMGLAIVGLGVVALAATGSKRRRNTRPRTLQ